MLRNLTLIDVVGSVEAFLVMTLILFVPGYVIGWVSNAFRFRQQSLGMQMLLSTPLAIAVMPIVVYRAGVHPVILWSLLAIGWAWFLFRAISVWRNWKRANPAVGLSRTAKTSCGFVLVWLAVAIASLVDLQFGNRLYFGVPAYDYSLRTAFTAAATRAIPPANPFFASVPPVALRYHYFWMLLCSLITRLTGIRPRHAMYGGTVWAGIALMCTIAISLKVFIGVQERLGRKALIGCGLLLVTGLDILPTIFLYARFHMVAADMEWWNEQITSWTDSLLWTPHHVMALVACMVGLLALRSTSSTLGMRVGSIVLAGVAFASAAGLSVLVTFTFAIFVALWLPYALLRRWWDDLAAFVGAGTVALLIALPYIHTLLEPTQDNKGHFVAFSIRGFPLAIAMASSLLKTPGDRLFFISLPLLPLNYFLELGFFFLVGILRMISIRRGSIPMSRNEETGWMIVATSFFVGTFLRSTTIGSNDLGWRCFLPAQLVLLLWAALLIDDWWTARQLAFVKRVPAVTLAAVLLVLGVVGTVYQVVMLRAYPILFDQGKVPDLPWLDQDHHLGERTYALRSAYDRLGQVLPPDAIIQYNPMSAAYIPHEIYSGHDAAAGTPICGSVFGGDAATCKIRVESIAPLFDSPSPAESANLDVVCRQYGISTMLVDDSDPVWKQRDSWAWTRTPMLANDRVRAFSCGDSVQQAKLTLERKQ